MNKKILILSLLFVLFAPFAFANEIEDIKQHEPNQYAPMRPPTTKEIKQIDKMIEQRLNLTPEQIKKLRANKQKNLKELQKTIGKMEANHKQIRNIYLLGIPKYQADIKSAPYKVELVILKQNADSIRNQNRKYFISILTPEQKLEFKKLRNELPRRKF